MGKGTHTILAQSHRAMGTVLCPMCASTSDNMSICLLLYQQ